MVTRVPFGSLSFFLVLRPRPLPVVIVVALVLMLLFERERGVLVTVVDAEGGVVVVDCFVTRAVAAVALEMPRVGSFVVVAVVVAEGPVVLAVFVGAAS